jgi:hypothetical protein
MFTLACNPKTYKLSKLSKIDKSKHVLLNNLLKKKNLHNFVLHSFKYVPICSFRCCK